MKSRFVLALNGKVLQVIEIKQIEQVLCLQSYIISLNPWLIIGRLTPFRQLFKSLMYAYMPFWHLSLEWSLIPCLFMNLALI